MSIHKELSTLVVIRDFKPGDEDNYAKIWNAAHKSCSWYPKHGPMSTSDAAKAIKHHKQSPGYKLFFAVVNKMPVGFIEAMIDENMGRIGLYQPCVLPKFQQQSIEKLLVKVAIEHLQRNGVHTIRFSIMGLSEDVAPYLDLYRSLGFKVWRQAQTMTRNLENIPDSKPEAPLKILTVKSLGLEAFADFFVKCFKDSLDRDASQIASSSQRAKQFIMNLRRQEDAYHDPDGWIAAFLNDQFVGFAIAIKDRDAGLIAEVGVMPKFRRRGFGKFLTVKVMKTLKKQGFKHAYLGVDIKNTPAISLYKKLGFKISRQIYELEIRFEA